MAGKAKSKRAGKGKAAPKQAKKPKAKVAAKSATSRSKATSAKKPVKKKPPAMKSKSAAKAKPTTTKSTKSKPAAKAKPTTTKSVKAKSTGGSSGGGALLQGEILAMARSLYGDRSDAELLALDPNSIDEMDPATFYEMVGEKFGVEGDPSNENFGGFGGPIRSLIEFVGSRWDGKTRGDAPMPPQAWLDEFVHPATERVPEQAEPLDEPLLD
jgi:hypothetical protein